MGCEGGHISNRDTTQMENAEMERGIGHNVPSDHNVGPLNFSSYTFTIFSSYAVGMSDLYRFRAS